MNLHRILAFAAVLPCVACDGHVRSFTSRTSAHIGGSVGQPSDRAKLLSAIRTVGAQRGYTEGEPRPNESASYDVIASYGKRIEHGSVTLRLIRDTRTDTYRVVIIDWPSFIRSAESKAVEQEIQSKLP